MPNHCRCKVRVGADAATIRLLKENKFSFEKLVPQPHFDEKDEGWYDWRIEHWGTKWDNFDFKIEHEGELALIVNFTAAWAPPYAFFESLLQRFPDLWLQCQWDEEGGMAGIFVGYTKDEKVEIKEMEWPDWCMEEWAHRMGPSRKN